MAILIPVIYGKYQLSIWLPPPLHCLACSSIPSSEMAALAHHTFFHFSRWLPWQLFCLIFNTVHVLFCRVKKTTTRVTKQNPRDPLEHIHSKLSTGGNSDSHEARVDKAAAAPSTVPTSSDASGRASPPVADVQATTTGIRTSRSDESVSARTTEILPTLLAMKDAAVSHATRSTSVEVDAPEINLSKEDSIGNMP